MARVELSLSSPYLNASGALGLIPAGPWPLPQPQGAFVTAPLGRAPRDPAGARCLLPFPGGYLLHTGLPGPGLSAALKKCAPLWSRAAIPVWVHILPETPYEAAEWVRRLEGLDNVAAVEIGLPAETSAPAALDLLAAAQGELPVVAALPLNAPSTEGILAGLPRTGIAALTLSPPRGALPRDPSSDPFTPQKGRLYGPALFPLVLEAVHRMRSIGLPLIAGAGVWTQSAAQALLAAGASALQLDGVLWRGRWLDKDQ